MTNYIDRYQSLGDQWLENLLCAETIGEILSIHHWYYDAVKSLVDEYVIVEEVE